MGESLQGRKLLGELRYMKMVAAHPTYPMGTVVRVTNLENQRTAELRIIDRSATAQKKEASLLTCRRKLPRNWGLIRKKRCVFVPKCLNGEENAVIRSNTFAIAFSTKEGPT